MRRKRDTIRIINTDIWVSRDEKQQKLFLSKEQPTCELLDGKRTYFVNEGMNDQFIYANDFLRRLGVNTANVPDGCFAHLKINVEMVCFNDKDEVLTFEQINKLIFNS